MSTRLDRIMNVLTLVVAMIALLIALYSIKVAEDSNVIAREANELAASGGEARVEEVYVGTTTSVKLTPCRIEAEYYVFQEVERRFSFANRGGQATSVADVYLTQGDYSVGARSYSGDGNKITWPLDIEPGLAREWRSEAGIFRVFSTAEAASNYLNSPQAYLSTGHWTVWFGHGEWHLFNLGEATISINPSTELEGPCPYQVGTG